MGVHQRCMTIAEYTAVNAELARAAACVLTSQLVASRQQATHLLPVTVTCEVGHLPVALTAMASSAVSMSTLRMVT